MIIKIVILGICVCIVNIIIRQYQPSYVIIINLVLIVVVFLFIIGNYSESFSALKNMLSINSVSLKMCIILYKAAAVCLLTKMGCDICLESGNKVIADIIEISGRIMLLAIALPYIESIIKTTSAFVK